MEKNILDALYEASAGQKAHLGYVRMTDLTDMINQRFITLWQPAPSTLAEAQAWADAQEVPHNHLLASRAVMSFTVQMASLKTVHEEQWAKTTRD